MLPRSSSFLLFDRSKERLPERDVEPVDEYPRRQVRRTPSRQGLSVSPGGVAGIDAPGKRHDGFSVSRPFDGLFLLVRDDFHLPVPVRPPGLPNGHEFLEVPKQRGRDGSPDKDRPPGLHGREEKAENEGVGPVGDPVLEFSGYSVPETNGGFSPGSKLSFEMNHFPSQSGRKQRQLCVRGHFSVITVFLVPVT